MLSSPYSLSPLRSLSRFLKAGRTIAATTSGMNHSRMIVHARWASSTTTTTNAPHMPGGSATYHGKSMYHAHNTAPANGLSEDSFDITLQHLRDTLEEADVAFDQVEEVIGEDETSPSGNAVRPLESREAEMRMLLSEHYERLTYHPLYSAIQTLAAVRIFQEHHIVSVWDFMSLVKALQIMETTVTVPWVPPRSTSNARLINEIVVGEESDDIDGKFVSHFEMYVDGMIESGANTKPILDVIDQCRAAKDVKDVQAILRSSDLPKGSIEFACRTFDVIENGKPHELVSFFTFGREDIIPRMFIELTKQLDLSVLRQYMERHIEVDGDVHSKLAFELLASHCGDDDRKWDEALAIAQLALEYRDDLWNCVYDAIEGCEDMKFPSKVVQP